MYQYNTRSLHIYNVVWLAILLTQYATICHSPVTQFHFPLLWKREVLYNFTCLLGPVYAFCLTKVFSDFHEPEYEKTWYSLI